jgi:hypothetical protein
MHGDGGHRADHQRGDLRGQLPPDGHLSRGVILVGVTIAPRLKRTSHRSARSGSPDD